MDVVHEDVNTRRKKMLPNYLFNKLGKLEQNVKVRMNEVQTDTWNIA